MIPSLLAIGVPGPFEMMLIMGVGLLFFGKRLPEVGKGMARGIVEFKKGLKEVTDEIDSAGSTPDAGPFADGTGLSDGTRLADCARERSPACRSARSLTGGAFGFPRARGSTMSNALRYGVLLAAATLTASFALADPPTTRATSITAEKVPLDDFLDTIRDAAAGLNLAINWPALEAVGVDRSTPISLRLRGLPIRRVLDLALQQAGQGKLAWYVSDGVVIVTSRELADRAMITRVYPVQDLTVVVPDFPGADVTVTSDSGGDATSGSSSSLFGGGSATNAQNSGDSPAIRGERLVQLIESIIRPDVWVENGGVASIRYFNGCLIVTAPATCRRRSASDPADAVWPASLLAVRALTTASKLTGETLFDL